MTGSLRGDWGGRDGSERFLGLGLVKVALAANSACLHKRIGANETKGDGGVCVGM